MNEFEDHALILISNEAAQSELQHGDQFSIYAWGLEYIYEVRTSRLVTSSNLSVIAQKSLDWVTLLTCESFDEDIGEYLYRRAVQAVLISVK